jgi:DNA-binding response OmpR family regulator
MDMTGAKERTLFALSVDHETALVSDLRPYLDTRHLQFDHAFSLIQAGDLARLRAYCLLLIRFEVAPEAEILQFCSFFRSRNPNAALIVLTNALSSALDERLFDRGANDVVNVRQTSPSTLAKRVRARLAGTKSFEPCPNRIRLGDALVDFDRREVVRGRSILRLPGILADLLRYFVENADHIVSREELQNSPIWLNSICTPAAHGGKTFDVNIGKLRKVIEPDPRNPRIIVSVRGVGWKLASELLQQESSPIAQSRSSDSGP